MTQLSLNVTLKFHVAYVKEDIFGRTMYSQLASLLLLLNILEVSRKRENPRIRRKL